MDAPCAPWIDPGDVELCDQPGAPAPVDLLADAVEVATALLFVKTGRRYTGECIHVWRPCVCPCGSRTACTCVPHPSLPFERGPVIAVSSVVVDGTPLAAADWALLWPAPLYEARLVNVSGEAWPAWQDITLPSTDPDTMEVTYTYGTPPPPGAELMVSALACQFVQLWQGGDCRLPQRLTTITRENLQMTVLDPMSGMEHGLLGLPEVDTWWQAFNPSGADRAPKVLNVDQMGLGHDPTDPWHTRGHRRAPRI